MIQINERIRIVRIDKLNLELQEYRLVIDKKTKAERQDWCRVGYYGDLKSAIGGAIKYFAMELADEDLNGWKSVMQRLDEIDKELKGATKYVD